MIRSLLLFSIVIVFASSCSKKLKYFTEDLYYDHRWTDTELSQIQFYLSEDIVLHRQRGNESSVIKGGKIRVVDGREIEEVIIPKGTPGVFVKSGRGAQMAISFDADDESNFLMFGPNERANGRFLLLAKEWKRRWGKVTYGGRIYETSSASAYAALLVDMKNAEKLRVKRKTVRGNRVD